MTYYHDDEVTIRDMEDADAMIIAAAELAQGDHVSVEKYQTRLRDRAEGRCAALVAEYCGCAAGYVNVYYDSTWGAFAKRGLCEIVDFGVLEKYRRRGIGKKLMDAAEALAFEKADAVYLGVGLHAGYGSAQRMYIKRGYVPDGSGAWYKDTACAPYGACANDDELVLYLSKSATASAMLPHGWPVAEETEKTPGERGLARARAKAILISGRICCGKTSYAEKLRLENRAALLSCDEITLALFDEQIGENHDEIVGRTEAYLFEKAVELIGIGVSVIFDWGFWTREERDYATAFFRGRGIETEWHYVAVSDDTWRKYLMKRNSAVLAGGKKFYLIDDAVADKFNAMFEAPAREEIDIWHQNDWS